MSEKPSPIDVTTSLTGQPLPRVTEQGKLITVLGYVDEQGNIRQLSEHQLGPEIARLREEVERLKHVAELERGVTHKAIDTLRAERDEALLGEKNGGAMLVAQGNENIRFKALAREAAGLLGCMWVRACGVDTDMGICPNCLFRANHPELAK